MLKAQKIMHRHHNEMVSPSSKDVPINSAILKEKSSISANHKNGLFLRLIIVLPVTTYNVLRTVKCYPKNVDFFL